MPLATNMPGFAETGVAERMNPATGVLPLMGGLSCLNVGPYRVPRASEFSSLGSLSITVRDAVGRMTIDATGNGTNGAAILLPSIPAAPCTIDVAVSMAGVASGNATDFGVGIGPIVSDGTGYSGVIAGACHDDLQYVSAVHAAASFNTPTSDAIGRMLWSYTPTFLRLTDDGTTRSFYVSQNGLDYWLIFSQANTTVLTATRCGIYIRNSSNANRNSKFTIYHFAAYAGVAGDAP